MMRKYELEPHQLTRACDLNCLPFETTEELEPLKAIMGQDRAVEAVKFGLKMKRKGYNIYVGGSWGTGRNSLVRHLSDAAAKLRTPPKDWLYVNNFKVARTPIAIGLPPGEGKEFIKSMGFIISFLKKEISNAFSGKDYENDRAGLLQEYSENTQVIIDELNEIGEKYGFRFAQNERGLISIPLKNNEPMTEEEYRNLTEEDFEKLKSESARLSIETSDLFNRLRGAEEQFRQKMLDLDAKTGRGIATFHLSEMFDKYRDNDAIVQYLNFLIDDIVENLERFKNDGGEEQATGPLAALMPRSSESFFDRYAINQFVNNDGKEHAPVVFASNPTYYNLLGGIEYKNELGVLKTDFTMIKPGLLHEANGGYLIVLAKDILTMPYAWKGLMRALLDDEITIESLGSQMGAIVSTTLKPQPIPLDVKIILIGDQYTYQLLYYYDEEFRKLFKVMADFDIEMDRNEDNIDKIARFIAKHCHEDGLRHFSRCAVGRVIEQSSRLADDQNKLSSHLNKLVDLIYEADSWADEDGAEIVESKHVDIALEMIEKRNNKIEEKVLEMFENGDYLLDVSGEKIGEINGLAVTGSGQYQFGKPTKITVSTYRGRAGIINIEREARTSGAIHDKGVMIISGYLGHKFAQDKPLALTASIVFEQLYSGIDGDSASSTELYALLSSLSEIPIRQSVAVTGSVNQRGEIQPIGGVNEKIHGYFKVCKLKGLNGEQGVIIPHQNVKNLMLSEEIIDAVKAGTFHIYSVHNIDEGIEILTGIQAGTMYPDGSYTKDSVYDRVNRKLQELIKPSPAELEALRVSKAIKAEDEEKEGAGNGKDSDPVNGNGNGSGSGKDDINEDGEGDPGPIPGQLPIEEPVEDEDEEDEEDKSLK
ncbi:MAG: AAA family ATPase [Acidaminobacter sp.]|nr:AAA family ATPase [Acidaminobacter sp.]